MSTYETADRIARHAAAMGLRVRRDMSNLSDSQYLDVWFTDEETGQLAEMKIRVSGHELPPGYQRISGAADFEVGDHLGAHGGWIACLRRVAETFARELPRAVLAAEKRAATVAARREAERLESERRQAEAREAARDSRQAIITASEDGPAIQARIADLQARRDAIPPLGDANMAARKTLYKEIRYEQWCLNKIAERSS